ncbi:unnamed protein product [Musa hybrid cultivar]
MDRYSGVEIVNVGSGREVSIREAAEMAKEVVGFKLVDGSKLAAMGWRPKVSLREGLAESYKWYSENVVEQMA